MDFSEIFTKAWKITWKHKILWLFGCLAGLGVNLYFGSIHVSLLFSIMMADPRVWERILSMPLDTQLRIEEFVTSLFEVPAWTWTITAVGLGLISVAYSIVFTMLGILSIAGMYKGASLADKAEKDEKPLSLKTIFSSLKTVYWKVLLFYVGFGLVSSVAMVVLFPLFYLLSTCTCGLGSVLMIPLFLLFGVLFLFACIAMIEENLTIHDAISHAWYFTFKHFGKLLLLFMLLYLVNSIVSTVIVVPTMAAYIPVLVNLVATGFQDMTVGIAMTAGLLLALTPVTTLLFGVQQSFVSNVWVLAYRCLTAEQSLEPEVLQMEDRVESEAD